MSHPISKTYSEVQASLLPIINRIGQGAAKREAVRELVGAEIKELAQAGFTAVRVPHSLGGAGLSVRELFSLIIEVAKADSNIPQALRAHFFIVEFFRLQGAEQWLKTIASGKVFGNAFTELGAGAIEQYKTTLTPTEGGYLLSGTKYYSTGTLYADYVHVSANLAGSRVLAIVPADAEGVKAIDDWTGFGQRLTASGTTIFDEVFVPHDQVYPTVNQEPAFNTAFLQLFHLATLTGIARRATSDVVAWVRERNRTYTHAVAALPRHDPLVQQIIGKLSGVEFTAQSTVLAVADILDNILTGPEHATNLELLNQVEASAIQAQITLVPLILQAINELFEVGGASIVDEKYGFDRLWRNARTLAVHNPAAFKARALGDYLLNDAPLPYQWQAGVKPA